MKRKGWSMRCKRKRADPAKRETPRQIAPGASLWFTEKLAGVDIAGQFTRRNAAKIVKAIGVRAIKESRCAAKTAERKTARRRRTITGGLILLNGGAAYRAAGRADRGADARAPNSTGSSSADDCPGGRAVT